MSKVFNENPRGNDFLFCSKYIFLLVNKSLLQTHRSSSIDTLFYFVTISIPTFRRHSEPRPFPIATGDLKLTKLLIHFWVMATSRQTAASSTSNGEMEVLRSNKTSTESPQSGDHLWLDAIAQLLLCFI